MFYYIEILYIYIYMDMSDGTDRTSGRLKFSSLNIRVDRLKKAKSIVYGNETRLFSPPSQKKKVIISSQRKLRRAYKSVAPGPPIYLPIWTRYCL